MYRVYEYGVVAITDGLRAGAWIATVQCAFYIDCAVR